MLTVALSSKNDTGLTLLKSFLISFHKQYLRSKKLLSSIVLCSRWFYANLGELFIEMDKVRWTQRILEAVHSICGTFFICIHIIPPKFIILLLVFLFKCFLIFPLLPLLILWVESSFLKTPDVLCGFNNF